MHDSLRTHPVDGPAVFISYRRTDAAGHARLLHLQLAAWFDREALFFDMASLDAGDAFPQRLVEAVGSAAVVLVLIGPDWVEQLNRRAAAAGVDYVRSEVAQALRRRADGRAVVIPVLLGGAAAPAETDLHETLRGAIGALCAIDMHEFRGKDADWNLQFERLRDRLARVPGVPAPRWRPPQGVQRPFPPTIGPQRLSPCFEDPHDRLAQLHAALRDRGPPTTAGPADAAAVVMPVVVHGMGGVGKTQLALRYVFAYREHYGGVWWFEAETAEGVQLGARAACEAAGIATTGWAQPMGALVAGLRQRHEPWLLVFDNATSLAAVREHLPDAGPHHVLVTSRDPAAGGMAAVPMRPWSREQAADFLEHRARDRDPGPLRADREALADDLGGLPLALEQAAAYLEATDMSVAEYRSLVQNAQVAPALLDDHRNATGYPRSVTATLSLAFERLDPAARELLRLLAWCAPEPVPEALFRGACASLAGDLGPVAADALRWSGVVGSLRRYGLAERVRAAGGAAPVEALQVHRLTQAVVRHRLSQRDADLATVLLLLEVSLAIDPTVPAHWPRYAGLLPHVLHTDAQAGDLAAFDAAGRTSLLILVARYLAEGTALHAQACALYERVAAALTAAHGAEHPDTLRILNDLAGSRWRQGDLRAARALHEQVLAARRRVLGDEHADTLTSMNNLAVVVSDQGDRAGARALEEQVLQARIRSLGADHPDTLTSMGNLAMTLCNLGERQEARQMQERVLDGRVRAHGDEHPDTLTARSNLATTLSEIGELAGARTLKEHVLDVRRRVLGAEHPDTLTSMNNLAVLLEEQGDLAGARALHEQVLAVRRRVLGARHPDTLSSTGNLASTLCRMGDWQAALPLEEQVAALRADVLGAEHPATLSALNHLALTLLQLGRTVEARALHERVLGAEHPTTLKTSRSLAMSLWSQGDQAGGLAMLEQTFGASRRHFGESHPDTVECVVTLSMMRWLQGDRPGARALLWGALGAIRQAFGESHPTTVQAEQTLARMDATPPSDGVSAA